MCSSTVCVDIGSAGSNHVADIIDGSDQPLQIVRDFCPTYSNEAWYSTSMLTSNGLDFKFRRYHEHFHFSIIFTLARYSHLVGMGYSNSQHTSTWDCGRFAKDRVRSRSGLNQFLSSFKRDSAFSFLSFWSGTVWLFVLPDLIDRCSWFLKGLLVPPMTQQCLVFGRGFVFS